MTQTNPAANKPQQEARTAESKSVDPAVQSEIARTEAEKRRTLLQDAQTALQETRNALAALDAGDSKAALAALERATGKLELLVARDPKMALAPVSVTTTILDLYAEPDTVRQIVKQARGDLADDRVQHARRALEFLASEADIDVAELPLATYPAAIKAVAPLINAGKIDEAKAALSTALSTLVVETLIIPLPRARAEAMLSEADQLAKKKDRNDQEKTRLRSLIEATQRELRLAEALGYGTKESYKPLYAQLDEVRSKTDSGESGGILDKIRHSIRNFRFTG